MFFSITYFVCYIHLPYKYKINIDIFYFIWFSINVYKIYNFHLKKKKIQVKYKYKFYNTIIKIDIICFLNIFFTLCFCFKELKYYIPRVYVCMFNIFILYSYKEILNLFILNLNYLKQFLILR